MKTKMEYDDDFYLSADIRLILPGDTKEGEEIMKEIEKGEILPAPNVIDKLR